MTPKTEKCYKQMHHVFLLFLINVKFVLQLSYFYTFKTTKRKIIIFEIYLFKSHRTIVLFPTDY